MNITTLRKRKNTTWLALAAVGVISGATLAFFSFPHIRFSNPSLQPPAQPIEKNPIPVAQLEKKVSIFWIVPGQQKFTATSKFVAAPDTEEAVEAALRSLFTAPPQEGQLYSAIPANAQMLNFSANEKDIFVNVSKEFAQGGGSASIQGRVIQVLYTATSLNPEANVFLMVEGQPIDRLGGEGLEIKQPMTRQDFPVEF